MNNEKLKPCPFCGGEAVVHKFGTGYIAECLECATSTVCESTKAEAIEKWNNRADSNNSEKPNLTYADVERMVKLNYHEYKEPRYCYWGETDSIAGMYFKIKTVDGADDLAAFAIELYKEDEDGSIDFLTDYQTLHSAIKAAQEFLVDLVAAALGVERRWE